MTLPSSLINTVYLSIKNPNDMTKIFLLSIDLIKWHNHLPLPFKTLKYWHDIAIDRHREKLSHWEAIDLRQQYSTNYLIKAIKITHPFYVFLYNSETHRPSDTNIDWYKIWGIFMKIMTYLILNSLEFIILNSSKTERWSEGLTGKMSW